MKHRKLGSTDLNLSTIGLGTWAIGGGNWEFAWGPQDDELSIFTIINAVEAGINWIDTAAAYGLGHSEKIIGKAIKELSEKPLIATKCGLVWDKDRHIYSSLRRRSIRSEAEQSLKRLGVGRIDLYQIHWPMPEEHLEEAWGEIAKLVKEGKIRYAGVSNFSIKQIERIKNIHPVASLQPPYNMLRRGIESELLEYCAKNKIGVIAYSPMERGLLTGKFTREAIKALPEDDHRRAASPFIEPELSANLDLIEGLKPIAAKYKCTLAQLAVSWVLRRDEITSAIVGARHSKQAEENAKASEIRLTKDDIEVIEKLLKIRENAFAAK